MSASTFSLRSIAPLVLLASVAHAGTTNYDNFKKLPYSTKAPPSCPPPGFKAMENFNLTAYIADRWYVQQQMPIAYLDENANYCVTAMYQVDKKGNGVPDTAILKPVLDLLKYSPDEININVFNYANQNEVNGKVQEGNLKAVALNPKEKPSELMVGPPFIPRNFWGPYWIIAAGPGPDKYEWALISGGPPKKQTESGYCETGDGINNSGLWIFTREQVASDATINTIRNIAKGLGFDLDVLQSVVQEGCTYENIQTM